MDLKSKYKRQLSKVERIVTKNSNCRKERNIISCANCPNLKPCNMNNYEKELAKSKEIGKGLSDEARFRARKEVLNFHM